MILPGAPGQTSLIDTLRLGCPGMTLPPRSMGRQLVTWHVTSSSAGTSQRYVDSFVMIQSTHRETGLEQEKPRGQARRGCSGSSPVTHLLLGACLSELLGLWEKENENFPDFHTTDHSEHRGRGVTAGACGSDPRDSLDAQCP